MLDFLYDHTRKDTRQFTHFFLAVFNDMIQVTKLKLDMTSIYGTCILSEN